MRTLGLALVALLLTGCTWPLGHPPRIGYVDHQTWVAPDGQRTPLPLRYGISSIVPYDDGFLVADNRYFEGSVGLWFVREGRPASSPAARWGRPGWSTAGSGG